MPTNMISTNAYLNFAIALAYITVFSVIGLPLAGCSDNGQGGPIISSLSTPTETPSSEGAKSDSDSTAVDSAGDKDLTNSETTDTAAIETEDSDPMADLPGPDGEEDPMVSVVYTPTGATARLTWDASTDPNVQGYFVHYGKQSSGEPGSCSYEESQRVGAPPATITGLELNTAYFFAISAFGESESEAETPCSNEVLVVTPAVPS